MIHLHAIGNIHYESIILLGLVAQSEASPAVHQGLVISIATILVQEPVIGLIKWLRPKGLKVCSYVEKCVEFKNQTLEKIDWYTKVLCAAEYPRGMQ